MPLLLWILIEFLDVPVISSALRVLRKTASTGFGLEGITVLDIGTGSRERLDEGTSLRLKLNSKNVTRKSNCASPFSIIEYSLLSLQNKLMKDFKLLVAKGEAIRRKVDKKKIPIFDNLPTFLQHSFYSFDLLENVRIQAFAPRLIACDALKWYGTQAFNSGHYESAHHYFIQVWQPVSLFP